MNRLCNGGIMDPVGSCEGIIPAGEDLRFYKRRVKETACLSSVAGYIPHGDKRLRRIALCAQQNAPAPRASRQER